MSWKPIEKMPKSIRKGFMRIYSFAPCNEGRMNLARAYQFDKRMGFRVCDMYMDIPKPDQSGLEQEARGE